LSDLDDVNLWSQANILYRLKKDIGADFFIISELDTSGVKIELGNVKSGHSPFSKTGTKDGMEHMLAGFKQVEQLFSKYLPTTGTQFQYHMITSRRLQEGAVKFAKQNKIRTWSLNNWLPKALSEFAQKMTDVTEVTEDEFELQPMEEEEIENEKVESKPNNKKRKKMSKNEN